jgi:hypothetical protein
LTAVNRFVAHLPKKWWKDVLFKELRGGMGRSQHQVTKDFGPVEHSIAILLKAPLLLPHESQDLPADQHCNAFALQQAFTGEVIEE